MDNGRAMSGAKTKERMRSCRRQGGGRSELQGLKLKSGRHELVIRAGKLQRPKNSGRSTVRTVTYLTGIRGDPPVRPRSRLIGLRISLQTNTISCPSAQSRLPLHPPKYHLCPPL